MFASAEPDTCIVPPATPEPPGLSVAVALTVSGVPTMPVAGIVAAMVGGVVSTGGMINVAETAVAAFTVSVHVVPEPLHAPAHVTGLEAVKVTDVPGVKFAVQVVGQEIPAGVLIIVP
jgi:hypothetical protein